MSAIPTKIILATLGVADVDPSIVDDSVNRLVGADADDFTRFMLISTLTFNKRLNVAVAALNDSSIDRSVSQLASITAAVDPLVTTAASQIAAITASTAATAKVLASIESIKADVAATKAATVASASELASTSRSITHKLVAANFTTITQPVAQIVIGLILMLFTGLIVHAVDSTSAEAAVQAALTPSQIQAVNTYAAVVACQRQRAFYVFRPDRDLGLGTCVTAL